MTLLSPLPKETSCSTLLSVSVCGPIVVSTSGTVVDFEKAERTDLIEQTNQEISILQEYLPKQLTKEEIKVELEKVISDLGATSIKDMGIIMKEAKNRIGAGADGRTINEVVKELLS